MNASIKIKREAHPFQLSEVTLLDGPFKHAMEVNRQYLLDLEPDRLLARFREYAGLEPKAPQYGGWESESLSGHTLGHYFSACSMMYASLGEAEFKARVDYITDELELCQNKHGDGYVSGIPGCKEVFLEVASGNIQSKGFDLNGAWAPLYTLHKLFAGLRDGFRMTGNMKALLVERKLADWLEGILSSLSAEQMEEMMICEYGGMNEVLADLYADTNEPKYLRLAERFWHKLVLDPLAEHVDCLPGKHANTQIPKLIGLAKEYELTSDEKRRDTAEFFWDRVVHHHSYANGGNSFGEYFGEPDSFNDRLGPYTTETCNTYNMLKLTKHMFEWKASANEADYYERALFNHILASQNPITGSLTYYLSLAMGGHKIFDDKFENFTCCIGTGMESQSSYGNSIYFKSEDKLYVNQYIQSKVTWKEKGVSLLQETQYPASDLIMLKLSCINPVSFSLQIRYPCWAVQGILIEVNGEKIETEAVPGSFVSINRLWLDGDAVRIVIPMSLRLETMPDNPDRAAVFFGPVLLAGDLGAKDDSNALDFLYTPVLLAKGKRPEEWLEPVPDKKLTFAMKEAGYPRNVELRPFYKMYDRSYSVYWDLFTPEGWAIAEADYKKVMEKLKLLEQCTIDYTQPGEMQPERDHNFQGDSSSRVGMLNRRPFRTAGQDGWFSFDLKVKPESEMMLIVTYTSAQEMPNCVFDVFLNGELLTNIQEGFAEEDKFYNVNFPLPSSALDGQEKVNVMFKAREGKRIRRVFGLRMVDSDQYKKLGVQIDS
ncbi:glycoside hydrolase family 127 protein [Paenibacillus alkaliterrae]|uniref:glycoside hydrolase family 127 protein n=1 Tax=Paenibacillus alkaliterrae TaxID=320909 RepID=UPI001F42BFAE|nr:glycoside hydrolase family 127 protein [Paenibacillus alkaliterrae]MCF2941749.1 glycoside hydrolase family 127 protein [Paenibacillus alkaliterrae]